MGHPARLVVGNRYSFTYRSLPEMIPGKGEFTPKFASGAFDGSIGKVVPLKFEGRRFGRGRLISAVVSDDGYSVEFTYEVTDLSPGQEGDTETGPVRS